ncbi:hypothetical protein AKJ16_DCAP07761 [Drosera capensis]
MVNVGDVLNRESESRAQNHRGVVERVQNRESRKRKSKEIHDACFDDSGNEKSVESREPPSSCSVDMGAQWWGGPFWREKNKYYGIMKRDFSRMARFAESRRSLSSLSPSQ